MHCSCVFLGNLCGACKRNNNGVGILSMLCQECENYNVYFLILLGMYRIVNVLCVSLPSLSSVS